MRPVFALCIVSNAVNETAVFSAAISNTCPAHMPFSPEAFANVLIIFNCALADERRYFSR